MIAGASQGAGLGHDFLRHIERTRLLIHLVDGGAEDVVADWRVVTSELQAYGHGLDQRPRLLVLNKRELVDPEELPERVKELEAAAGQPVLVISAAMAEGLEALLQAVWSQLGIEGPR